MYKVWERMSQLKQISISIHVYKKILWWCHQWRFSDRPRSGTVSRFSVYEENKGCSELQQFVQSYFPSRDTLGEGNILVHAFPRITIRRPISCVLASEKAETWRRTVQKVIWNNYPPSLKKEKKREEKKKHFCTFL